MEEWTDKIFFPRIAENVSQEEKAAFKKKNEVSKFFGGIPQAGAAGEKTTLQCSMPKLEMLAPGATPAGARKEKKKEGC